MGTFYLWGSLQFATALVLGLPFSTGLMMRDKAPHSSGWLLLAPALGATLYFSVGTILHSFGLRGPAVFWTLAGLSAAASVALLGSRKRRPLRGFLIAVGVCFFGAALALALNSADLSVAGLDYFPLTNDDTFSYLGFIDQIRATGWIVPRVSYPAGYIPLIDHIFMRTPGVIFPADFADILALETHSAFFLSQRVALPMMALGASAIVMIVTGNWVATLLCFAPLVFGNVLLHQILQQFNSSTMGTVIGTVIVALAIWTVRSERTEREIVAGHALVGWASGTLAITSMEAHPFYLMAFSLVALLPIVRDRQLKRAFGCLSAFVGAYLAASFTLVIKVWSALISQFVNAANGHPGDWIAAPGFLMQATGVKFTTTPRLMSYAFPPLVTAIIVLVVLLSAIAIIGRSLAKVDQPGPVLRTDRFVLFCIVVLVTILQIFLYVRGSGYGLLKLTDYFAFLGSVIIGVAAFQVGLTKVKSNRRAALIVITAYCLVTFVEKQHILQIYRERTSHMPLPSAYSLDGKPTSETVSADLSAEPLNLFLYENRYSVTPIVFRSSESNRFALLHGIGSAAPRYIARIPSIGVAGAPLADITYPAETMRADLTVVAAAGQIHLLLPDPHWLAPEGETVGQLRRWLSVSGKFVVFGPLTDQMHLALQMAAGPDLRPDNRIEVYFAGHLLQSLDPTDLPFRIDTPIAMQAGPETEGEIRIVGSAAGIRQVSVAQLRSVQH
jgi:hypothetical protein